MSNMLFLISAWIYTDFWLLLHKIASLLIHVAHKLNLETISNKIKDYNQ